MVISMRMCKTRFVPLRLSSIRESTPVLFLTILGGLAIGLLGGLLGVGGGVFWVPFLVLVVGLSPLEAVGISLFCVIGTSIAGSQKGVEEERTHVPLALHLEPLMVLGAVGSSVLAHRVSDAALLTGFALLLMVIAVVFFVVGRPAHVKGTHEAATPSWRQGRLQCPEEGTVDYVVQRPFRLMTFVFGTGCATGFFGIGGGVLNVPWMTLMSKVPLRAAAATSTFTMAMTGAAASMVHFAHGSIAAEYVAAALLGVLPGGRLGERLLGTLPEKWIRWIFSSLLLATGSMTLLKAVG